jgi:hypothetical protein
MPQLDVLLAFRPAGRILRVLRDLERRVNEAVRH